jgi:tRNA pseudouridine55 synthase
MDGLLVVDKPVGPTSHDAVVRVRKALGEHRVGHTGTLDPDASGVLPLVVGRATRLARFLSAADKRYEATIRLGIRTDTYDSAGEQVGTEHTGPPPTMEEIEGALNAFRGTFLQQPPAYSAKKIGGKRSHRLARNKSSAPASPAMAVSPALPAPVAVTAHAIHIVGLEGDRLMLRVACSAGFYVRSLAHDLGERLETGAHLTALRRTASGDVTLDDAVPLQTVEREGRAAAGRLLALERLLPALLPLTLTDEGVRRARHGRELGPADFADHLAALARLDEQSTVRWASDRFRLFNPEGRLVGLAEPSNTPGLLHPAIVLV